jgi:hypothetical protein
VAASDPTPVSGTADLKAGDIVRDAGRVVSRVTSGAAGTAGQVLTPVSPAAGTALQQTGATASDTVGGATKTIAGAVDDVLSTRR